MGGRHIHALIPDKASLLIDVGCGSGAVSASLGQKHPSTKVLGVDLSAVPSTTSFPSNVEFLQGNIRELICKDTRLMPGNADLVYSRLLILGMKKADWPDHVKALESLLKPGGYLELIEIEQSLYDCTDFSDILGTRRPVREEWCDAWRKGALEGYGSDPDVGMRLVSLMQDAGLYDIQERLYPCANGDWIEQYMPEATAIAKIDQSHAIGLAMRNAMEGMFPDKKIAEYVEKGRAWFKGNPSGQFLVLHAVTGRKLEVEK